MWAVDPDGALRRFYGAGDGTITENSKTASDFSFTDVRITHRGDWTNDAYEDLVALRHDATAGIDRLWVHPNNGFGFACTSCNDGTQRQELTVYNEANNHWKNGARQILAVGDVDGGLDIDGDGNIGPDDLPGYPDLLVNDGQFLWLYYGAPDNRLDSYRDPVLLASGDSMSSQSGGTLDKITLAAPGDFTGDGHLDLVARFDAGGLFLYDSIDPDGPNGPDQATPDHRIQIGSGWNTLPLLTAAPTPASRPSTKPAGGSTRRSCAASPRSTRRGERPAVRCAPAAAPGSPTNGGRPSSPPGGAPHAIPTRTCATTASSAPSPPNVKLSRPGPSTRSTTRPCPSRRPAALGSPASAAEVRTETTAGQDVLPGRGGYSPGRGSACHRALSQPWIFSGIGGSEKPYLNRSWNVRRTGFPPE
ncbi:VCBS repeat-containing protein [Streptomyces sp. I6]|uniref:FG-GAP repeat domain-containing protein n=1 Tax=Streptomyces sp. I6 TaxID=2483113 RepID=UPI00160A8AFE|nr:VCBS repeat-containing protein [Streptomyces sp. I6]